MTVEIEKEIVYQIRKLEMDCPDCENMYSDEQYTCTTCWCQGGGGTINVLNWIIDNPRIIKNQKLNSWSKLVSVKANRFFITVVYG